MSFAFFVLGPGFGLATIAFIVELVYKRTTTGNRKADSSNHRKAPVLKLAADVVIAVAAPSKKRRKNIKTPMAEIPVVSDSGLDRYRT